METKSEPSQPSGRAGCFAAPLAALLALALPLSLLAFDLWRVAFNPPLVKRLLLDEVVRSDLIPLGLEWYSEAQARERVERGDALSGVTEPDIERLMSFLDNQDWSLIQVEVLPDDVLAEWVTTTVDGAYAWIDSDDRVPDITWSLLSFKTRIRSEHGANAIQVAYDNLPACQPAEVDDFLVRLAAAPAGGEVLYNLCAFPNPWREDQLGDYRAALDKVAASILDEFSLTEALARVPDTPGVGPTAIKQDLRLIRRAAGMAWLAPLALALLLGALMVRSLETLGAWIARPALAGGLLALLPPLLFRPALVVAAVVSPLGESPLLVRQEATRVLVRLANHVLLPLLWQGLAIVGVCLALLVFELARGRRRKVLQAEAAAV